MKKQVKVVISLVVVIAILVAGISLFFPEVFKGLTSGTFGKAEKYHKSQMTEKDVQLRSELTADTGQLKSMIQGLIYFSIFTQDLSNKIDSCVSTFQQHGICSEKNGCANVMILQDYSDFIKNNNKTLGTTISMLTGFYLKDQSDQSTDIERNLRDFGNYVNNLSEKDSILESSLKSMDSFMLSNKTLKSRKTELANLKSIRDQLLVKGVQLAALLQDKPLSSSLVQYALSSQDGLHRILNQDKVGVVASHQGLNVVICSADQIGNAILQGQVGISAASELQIVLQNQQVQAANSQSKDLGAAMVGAVLVYDKPGLQFAVSNMAELHNAFSATEISAVLQGVSPIGVVGYFAADGLHCVQSSFDLQNAFNASPLSRVISAAQVSAIFANQGIGSVSYGNSFIGLVGELQNQKIGIIVL